MRKLAHKLLLSLLAAGLMFAPVMGGQVSAAAASSTVQSDIQVYVDGSKISFKPAPIQEKGTTLVPMRPIFQALGAQVTWEQQSRTVIARKDFTTISLKVGSQQGVVNGKSVKLQVPAKLVRGTTMVPLRFIGEALGAKLSWSQAKRTITITSLEAQQEELSKPPVLEKYTAAEIVAMNDDKVVMIETDYAQGSGVVIGDRWILTNYHVMLRATAGTVWKLDGTSMQIKGLVEYDETADLAIIETSGPLGIKPVEIGRTDYLAKGDRVVAIGSPLGMQNTVSEGLISNFHYEGYIEYLQINAPIDHGSSGGALFNENGQLIGITTSKVEGSSANLNFAVSSYNVEMLMASLADKGGTQTAKFLPSTLPDSLANASNDEIASVMKESFGSIQTMRGITTLRDWKVTRDAQGWLVITATIDPTFYMYYSEAVAGDMRLWTVDAVTELKRMLPDQPFEMFVYYEQTFGYEPRGIAANEKTLMADGKWKVSYPVIHAQASDRAHIDIRS
ncbi:stalk domain-containing protein [Paenibacillus abyssi]|uniref:Copper amine oxidase-like N-terminal domain-containing protein n=1 Tax=Paenibacillus abyssi TaxID=1340531 RepID=A0A917FTW5_9BACL|nr:stalk domain-containing protein [Paenibacillus abyssi]GGG04658.1 hypothetical protein GCM10010916_22110 [Paenibacillus abyssi]